MDKLTPQPAPPPKDPTATNHTWTIALVVSAVFFLAAIGVVLWLVMVRSQAPATPPPPPPDPAIGVKNASLVLPQDMPATYVKHDQSRVGETFQFYDEEATGCSIVLGVLPAEANKEPQTTVLERNAAAYAEGVETTGTTMGEQLTFKDADGTQEYSFASVEIEQKVQLPGVGLTGRHQATAYKKLGNQVVGIGYGCKSDTWLQQREALAGITAKITIKTER